MEEKHRHHHVPKFHLKKWYGDDDRFFLYRKYRNDTIFCQKKVAKQHFYEKDLNSLKGDGSLFAGEGTKPDFIEDKFGQEIDDTAAPVLEKLISIGVDTLSEEERKVWAIYVRSLEFRTPAKVASGERMASELMRQQKKYYLQDSDGEERESTLALFENVLGPVFQNNFLRYKMLESAKDDTWTNGIAQLKWVVSKSDSATPQFVMTPDPVWRFEYDGATWFFAVPLCPEELWIAFPSQRIPDTEHESCLRRIARGYNLAQMRKRPSAVSTAH